MSLSNSCDDYTCNERRPLLYDPEQNLSRPSKSPTPLPKTQLVVLCLVRLADPVAFTQLFPYVNDMMARFNVAEPEKTGFYSGLVESIFAFSQLLTIYQWASISDRTGRKPVVLLGTIGIAFSTILLGFSRTFAGMLIARSLAGLFSGNVAVMHSVLGELTDSTNQALAYPIYGLCWPIGVIIGPLIGGVFSDAAQKYPKWFGTALFEAYPYLLPCLVVAVTTMIACPLEHACHTISLCLGLRSELCRICFRCRIRSLLLFSGSLWRPFFLCFPDWMCFSDRRYLFSCVPDYFYAFTAARHLLHCYDNRRLLWLGLGATLATSRIGCLAFSLNMILVKERAPGPLWLASANGLAQFSQCFARAVAPAFVSCLFAFSVDHGLLGGHFWMFVMFVISLLSWLHSATVPEDSNASDIDVCGVINGI
ncbi:hypothetical protein EW145_g3866 [Phellinidium pouzarii]|uniref:Major facilitator superfamily (MFS) profile domain-containing protein n=1 Tax=Phellinidium pouzarii TaxID=167371 RepID=A0A4V6S171_9AGAM|nr:hypothetical protein EW145_g3866 [Phellinidium pouzarii]